MDNPYALPPDAEEEQQPEEQCAEEQQFESIKISDLCEGYIADILPGMPPEDIRAKRARQAFMRGVQAAMYALHRSYAAGPQACSQQQQDLALELNRWIDETERQAEKSRMDSIPRIIQAVN